MKRSLIFCAIALVAVAANTASAAVDVQLNLWYTNPADEAGGGTWDLLVLSDGGGVAGVSVLIDGVSGAGADGTTGFNVFKTQPIGSVAEIVAGFDLVSPATDVGLGAGTTGAVADDLFPGNSPTWDNSALIASGTFGATRPSFVASAGTQNEGVNEFSGTDAVATTFGTQSVRGDGVDTDGLLAGDRDRNGTVSLGLDIVPMLGNLGNAGGWAEGDFDADGSVSLGLDVVPVLGNLGLSSTPPAVSGVGAVPEPTSLILCSMALALAGMRRRR